MMSNLPLTGFLNHLQHDLALIWQKKVKIMEIPNSALIGVTINLFLYCRWRAVATTYNII